MIDHAKNCQDPNCPGRWGDDECGNGPADRAEAIVGRRCYDIAAQLARSLEYDIAAQADEWPWRTFARSLHQVAEPAQGVRSCEERQRDQQVEDLRRLGQEVDEVHRIRDEYRASHDKAMSLLAEAQRERDLLQERYDRLLLAMIKDGRMVLPVGTW